MRDVYKLVGVLEGSFQNDNGSEVKYYKLYVNHDGGNAVTGKVAESLKCNSDVFYQLKDYIDSDFTPVYDRFGRIVGCEVLDD